MPHLNGNNPANDPNSKPVRNRSKFKPNRSLFQTMSFGLNTPHFAMEAVEGDKVSVRVGSDVDTQTIKAPVMCPVKMSKDYFFVPTRAILPRNAELLITNPLSGDDVDAKKVNCGIDIKNLRGIINSIATAFERRNTQAGAATSLADADAALLAGLEHLIYLEQLTSAGSLLAHVGLNFYRSIEFGIIAPYKPVTTDKLIDLLCMRLREDIEEFTFKRRTISWGGSNFAWDTATTFIVNMDVKTEDTSGNLWSFEMFLDALRQGMFVEEFSIPAVNGLRASADLTRREFRIYRDASDTTGYTPSKIVRLNNPASYETEFLNLSRLVAYQLACAQYYSDDSVDYVYSTKLWHDNQTSLLHLMAGNTAVATTAHFFKYNGIMKEYDECSAAMTERLHFYLTNTNGPFGSNMNPAPSSSACLVHGTLSNTNTTMYGQLGYFMNLFGLTRSLKYRDYFCGSRPNPLAVGNVNVTVSGTQFSVVDVTKNIQIQRYLNQVNRIGRRFSQYVQGIFGVTPMTDPNTVIFLGHTTDMIGGEETENTGAAQLTDPQTVTSKFRTSSSRFAFEGSFSDEGVMIGITNFDCVRPYPEAIEAQFHHMDRYEKFNPFMQNIGDQAVPRFDLDPNLPFAQNFGYKLRYSEYKETFDRIVGGFLEYLPGYAFPNNPHIMFMSGRYTICPDFIRALPCEFDRFFLSMPNYSMAGRFHFIIRQDITVDASRPMEAAPSIL